MTFTLDSYPCCLLCISTNIHFFAKACTFQQELFEQQKTFSQQVSWVDKIVCTEACLF